MELGDYGWCAKTKKNGEWVQIDATKIVHWRKVSIRGRASFSWVKKFSLKYSNDGITWADYPGTFNGCDSAAHVRSHTLLPIIQARMLRIVVLSFYDYPTMGFEAYYSE